MPLQLFASSPTYSTSPDCSGPCLLKAQGLAPLHSSASQAVRLGTWDQLGLHVLWHLGASQTQGEMPLPDLGRNGPHVASQLLKIIKGSARLTSLIYQPANSQSPDTSLYLILAHQANISPALNHLRTKQQEITPLAWNPQELFKPVHPKMFILPALPFPRKPQ